MAIEPDNPTKGHKVFSAKELQDFNELIGAVQDSVEKVESEVKAQGSANGETKGELEELSTKLDAMDALMTKKWEEVEQDLAKKRKELDDIEARLARKHKGAAASDEKKAKGEIRAKAFFDMLTGKNVVGERVEFGNRLKEHELKDEYWKLFEPRELKELQLGDFTLGGVNAPIEFVEELVSDLQEQNPVRGLFRQRPTARRAIHVPRRTGFVSAVWVAELESRSETTGFSFGRIEIVAHEMHGLVKVTREDLEDSFFSVEDFVAAELTEQFGRAEGVAFISGNGVGRPEGFMTNPDVGFVTTANVGALHGDDFISVYYDLLTPFLANSTWVMERATLKKVRQLKESSGQYIWAPGLAQDARPATILDRPYVAADEMDSVTTGQYPVAFGDFRQAYWVVDRLQMEMITDIYSSKATGEVEFSARKRTGGKVVLPQALRKLKVA